MCVEIAGGAPISSQGVEGGVMEMRGDTSFSLGEETWTGEGAARRE